jgi:hypothetical protein
MVLQGGGQRKTQHSQSCCCVSINFLSFFLQSPVGLQVFLLWYRFLSLLLRNMISFIFPKDNVLIENLVEILQMISNPVVKYIQIMNWNYQGHVRLNLISLTRRIQLLLIYGSHYYYSENYCLTFLQWWGCIVSNREVARLA